MNEWISGILLFSLLAFSIWLLRWGNKQMLNKTKKESGKKAEAKAVEIFGETYLVAKNEYDQILIAKPKTVPETLTIEIKTVVTFIMDSYTIFKLADGNHVHAREL